jgi:3-phosphoshikimate 1-carboxyvinyltransferase
MALTVSPGNPLRGSLALPGDKSLSHRAALFAALAQGESRVSNFLVSGVTQAMLGALSALGVPWELEGTALRVSGVGLEGLESPSGPIDCGNSATTLRLLAGALAAANLTATLDGSSGLRKRPMGRIVEPLQRMGVRIASTGGHAPLHLKSSAGHLKGLQYELPVASAQVKTCLLLTGLAAEGTTILREPGPSRDHSERMLRSMGAAVESNLEQSQLSRRRPVTVRLDPPGSRPLSPLRFRIPGDISSAAFLIVAALITPGSRVELTGVGLNPTRTGLLEALSTMGAEIQVANRLLVQGEPVGDLVVRHSPLHGTAISGPLVVRMIDEFPIFAVAAACAEGSSQVRQASELRHKESDRISALCRELSWLGVDTQEHADGFTINGQGGIPGGRARSHGDHRLAMALAVAGLTSRQPVRVQGASILSESFPDFVPSLRELGADIRTEIEVEADV